MTVDLLLFGAVGDLTRPYWPSGEVFGGVRSASELHRVLAAWLGRTTARALLCWDLRLGSPDRALVERLLAGTADVWHAGLLLGAQGHPRLLDFVAPTWVLGRDPSPDHTCTSWRVSLSACLVRTEVFRQLGLPREEFDTVSAAALEWGHRAIVRGAFLRHVPELGATRPSDIPNTSPTLQDEVRFIAYRYGQRWATWACARAAMSRYADSAQLLQAWRRLPPDRPYSEPMAYRRAPRALPASLFSARVTVLIPTINRYPYLRVVLENLRHQTIRPFEIIIIDQTSRESRDLGIADTFRDLPLRLLYRDEAGQCSSRNAGLKASRGDYILFLDDDVEIDPTLLEDHLRSLHALEADVSSGVIRELGEAELSPAQQFVRQSDVFPAGNSLVRRQVLEQSGLFDLAFDRAPRADGELGMRMYLFGALMVLDQSISVLHHRAPQGGLRIHRARVTTYRTSRENLTERHLPHTSEIYLARRHFSPHQAAQMLWLRTFATLSGRGNRVHRLAKAMIGALLLPDTMRTTLARKRQAASWLQQFPKIDTLAPHGDELTRSS